MIFVLGGILSCDVDKMPPWTELISVCIGELAFIQVFLAEKTGLAAYQTSRLLHWCIFLTAVMTYCAEVLEWLLVTRTKEEVFTKNLGEMEFESVSVMYWIMKIHKWSYQFYSLKTVIKNFD